MLVLIKKLQQSVRFIFNKQFDSIRFLVIFETKSLLRKYLLQLETLSCLRKHLLGYTMTLISSWPSCLQTAMTAILIYAEEGSNIGGHQPNLLFLGNLQNGQNDNCSGQSAYNPARAQRIYAEIGGRTFLRFVLPKIQRSCVDRRGCLFPE